MTRRSDCLGFTLIELLVVVLIIGLGISVVALSVGDRSAMAQLQGQAREFANQSALVAEEAVLSGQQWGIDLYARSDEVGEFYGYRWLALNPESGLWEAATPVGMAFSGARFAGDARLELFVDGTEQPITPFKEAATDGDDNDRSGEQREALLPDVLLLSSGEVSPFQLRVRSESDPAAGELTVISDALGRIQLETPDDEP